MKSNRTGNEGQGQFLSPDLESQLDPRQPLYKLAKRIPWEEFEKEFGLHYSREGRPAKPIRLMVSLLILKQMYQLGDRTVVANWVINPYWQYLSGEKVFQWELPVEPSDLVHFRNRIGVMGMEKVLQVSIGLHGQRSQEEEVVIDTTVQEKAITYPTDSKMHVKIINRCQKAARRERVELRQSYARTVGRLVRQLRFGQRPENRKRARRAARKLKTIAGRLVRELERKLKPGRLKKYEGDLQLYGRVLKQKKDDRNKIYSLHEPEVACLSKGKEYKKYEFGSKASVGLTAQSGIIVAAVNFAGSPYDGHTLDETLNQTQRLTGKRPEKAIVDRGYRGRKWVEETEIMTPEKGTGKSRYHQQLMRRRFRRRAGIEPIIGHLKHRFKLHRNWLKGSIGDQINLLLAAAAFNFTKWMNLLVSFCALIKNLLWDNLFLSPYARI